jgi:serine/threonine protein phosphatase 1
MNDGANHDRPQVPEGSRIYAIGDIHGRIDLLRRLHTGILADAQAAGDRRRVVVYLGDYVDRGGHSREVIESLVADPLPGFECVHLLGNHEAFMLRFLDDPDRGDSWVYNGGDATLRNYGVELGDPAFAAGGWAWLRDQFIAALPERHLSFLRSLRLWHAEGDYLFVHAGIRPGVPLERQSRDDLLWIREDFLDHDGDLGCVVVHGHSRVRAPTVRHNRIAIDTGAWMTGTLTGLVLDGGSHGFIDTKRT